MGWVKIWPECQVTLSLYCTLSLFLRGCNLPLWSLVLPLWAVWKIHQAFPLESVRIRVQALQWPLTWHFYHSTFSNANVMFRKHKITAEVAFWAEPSASRLHCTIRCTRCRQQHWTVRKADGVYASRCRLFTLMVRDLTFPGCEFESGWLCPVWHLRAGRGALYLWACCLACVWDTEHCGCTGDGQNRRNTRQ